MLKRLLCGSVFLLLALAHSHPVSAQAVDTPPAAPSIPSAIDLQDGDTLVFLGDSITHQRLYTQYVEDFFYQRFPKRRITFHNAGVGGARAWDALARLNRDVLDYKPRYVSILLGMNDGSYQPFNPEIFATYQQDMAELARKIRDGGAVPILMSPTMFDSRAAEANPRRQREPEMLAQYNSVLAYFGRWLQHVAMESGMAYVDMFSLLNDITLEARESDPNFTLIRDAIHPDPPGQIVMAFAMIDDLGLRKPLSSIRIQPNAAGVMKATATGGQVNDLQVQPGRVEFDWTADALPWVLPEEAQAGVKLLNLGHKASREALEVHGLEPGRYELTIDDTVAGIYPHTFLSRHIELQDNSRTPQYQQALEVALLNKQRNEGPVKQLRDAWRSFQTWARQNRELQQQPNNAELAAAVEKTRGQLQNLEATITQAQVEAKKIEDKIYTINQPQTRRFVLRKL